MPSVGFWGSTPHSSEPSPIAIAGSDKNPTSATQGVRHGVRLAPAAHVFATSRSDARQSSTYVRLVEDIEHFDREDAFLVTIHGFIGMRPHGWSRVRSCLKASPESWLMRKACGAAA